MRTGKSPRLFLTLSALGLSSAACAVGQDLGRAHTDGEGTPLSEDAGVQPGTAGLGAGGGGGAPQAAGAGAGGLPDAGMTSGVFGTAGTAAGSAGGQPPACEDSTEACDFGRIEGCCSAWACERASGADVFNTYPVESCHALVECVKAHPGCSNAADPLCFQNEDPSAPCLMEGYQASHLDPDGPFAWTAALLTCVCGY